MAKDGGRMVEEWRKDGGRVAEECRNYIIVQF